jgi:phosphoglycerate dehydrogenase-like enzyme
MKLLIALQHPFALWNAPAWLVERLRADFPQLEVVHLSSYKELDRELPTADVFLGWSLKPEQVGLAKKLRWIHSPAAAVHALLSPELAASPVVVTNARSVHGPVVAEHALALMLALAKRLPSAVRYQDQKTWSQQLLWEETPRPRELSGATLALIGYGAIGREVARLATAFSMRVLVVREHPVVSLHSERSKEALPSEPSSHEGALKGRGFSRAVQHPDEPAALAAEVEQLGPKDLDRALARADFVVLAAPLTPKTRGLINAARLKQMKRDAYLINVARGALIDDPALIAALKNKQLGAAALDVFEKEPLPADSPYWTLPNVLITPHSASLTEKLWERHYALLSENLRRFLAGVPLLAVVNKHAGY